MLNMTELYYFSPTGGTIKASGIFCEGISKNVKTIDLGLQDKMVKQPESELVVVSAPVFGGRIPAIVEEKLNQLEGKEKELLH